MGRWLSRIQESPAPTIGHKKMPKAPGNNPTQPIEPPSVGYVGKPTGAFAEKTRATTPQQVETILAGLAAAGRDLGNVGPAVRWTMQAMSREAAAELAVALDDAFQTADSVESAQWQCRRLIKNPQALEAAKAVWPDLPPSPTDAPAPDQLSNRPKADNTPRWLRLIRERCQTLPEDESYLRRHLGSLAPGDALARAERYAVAWEQAAKAEPRPAAKDNAGRRAANTELRGGKRHA